MTRQKKVSDALCLQCQALDTVSPWLQLTTEEVAPWLRKLGRDTAVPPTAPPSTAHQQYPSKNTVKISVAVGGKRRKVCFWAAKSRKIGHSSMSAKEAYGSKYPNQGVAWVNRDGILTMRLRAPQPYWEAGRLWPPHVHFAVAEKGTREWESERVYTVPAYPGHKIVDGKLVYSMTCVARDNTPEANECCFLTPMRLARNWTKFTKVINALPGKRNYGRIETTQKEKDRGKRSVRLSFKCPEVALRKMCDEIQSDPYVVYCYNSDCDAASQLIARMVSWGCGNVYYLPVGIQGVKAAGPKSGLEIVL